MNEASTAADRHIDRRIVLKAGVALATAGPVILRVGHAEAQPRATALFAYVGAFTTPERKGHGGGINVYRVDPTSGAWTQEQLIEVDNPSFLTLDRAQRFLYSVHADLDEVSAYAITSKPGTSPRSTGSPAAARTRRTCRSNQGISVPIKFGFPDIGNMDNASRPRRTRMRPPIEKLSICRGRASARHSVAPLAI